jgi:cytochrome oxidase Cu insertion factor (SCO1/SenC/PrrC family)
MKVRPKVSRPTTVLLVSAALWLGLTLSIAQTETPAPPMGLAEVNPPIPMAAFTLPGLDGSVFDSSTLRDKVVVVRFWATW